MTDLPKRKLGRTGLEVTTLGFGALELHSVVAGIGRPLAPGEPDRILNGHTRQGGAGRTWVGARAR